MKEYFVSIISIILFLSIIDLLVSKTKNGKIVKTIISLISVTLLAVPIVSLIKGKGLNFDNFSLNSEYLTHLYDIESEIIKSKIKIALNNESISFVEVDVVFSDYEKKAIKKILIKISDEVIIGSNEHINMIESAKTALKDIIDTDLVVVEIESFN